MRWGEECSGVCLDQGLGVLDAEQDGRGLAGDRLEELGCGGDVGGAFPWVRHPTADVNIGQNSRGASALTTWTSRTNHVKVMDSQGLWNGTAADNTVTPSCFSCHKSHGNKNGFGLIFMSGTPTAGPVTEEGDGGQYRDLCKQCHVQGG